MLYLGFIRDENTPYCTILVPDHTCDLGPSLFLECDIGPRCNVGLTFLHRAFIGAIQDLFQYVTLIRTIY